MAVNRICGPWGSAKYKTWVEVDGSEKGNATRASKRDDGLPTTKL